jgi:hypothetical protein
VVLSLIQLLIQYPYSILTALCHPPCIHCLLQLFANCSKTLLCPVSPFPPSPSTLHVTSWVYYLLPQATGFQPPLAYSISVNFIQFYFITLMQLKQIKHSLNCVLHNQYKYCMLVAQMFFPQKQ